MVQKSVVGLIYFCALTFLLSCGATSNPVVGSPLTIMPAAPPDGTIGASYGGTQGFSFVADGGTRPYTWSWTAAPGSALPPGLSLSALSGAISGTPTLEGVYSISITVSDSRLPSSQASTSYHITINGSAAVGITSPTPPDAILGMQYGGGDAGFSLTASGGVAPYTWAWVPTVGSSLPPGLTLSSAGVISGTATTAGSYTVTITVSDAESPSAQSTSNYTIDEIPATGLAITSGTPPSGKVNAPYGGFHVVAGHEFRGFPLGAVGGTAPYTWDWSAEAGSSLPPGLAVAVLFWGGSTRCCVIIPVIDGTPTTSGTYDVLLRVTDSASPPNSATARYTIDIQP